MNTVNGVSQQSWSTKILNTSNHSREPTIVDGPSSPASKLLPTISIMERRISGADEPSLCSQFAEIFCISHQGSSSVTRHQSYNWLPSAGSSCVPLVRLYGSGSEAMSLLPSVNIGLGHLKLSDIRTRFCVYSSGTLCKQHGSLPPYRGPLLEEITLQQNYNKRAWDK